MSDLIDLSSLDSVTNTSNILAIGAIAIFVLCAILAFIYGRINAHFEYKLRLKGDHEDLLRKVQNLEIELKEKQRLNEAEEKKNIRLKSEYEQFAANKEAIDQVKGQLNALGSEYQGKLQQLQDLDRELSKSEALKDFINNHQQEQLDALDQKIKDKEEQFKKISEQVSEKLSSSIVTDSLSQMFAEMADNSALDAETQKLQKELNELRKQYEANAARLREQEKELNKGKLNDAINKAFSSFNEQAARSQQAKELSSKLQQLSQQVQAKEKDLRKLQAEISAKSNQYQLSEALNSAFDELKDTLSQSMQNLASELADQSQLTAQKTQLQQEVAALEEKAKNANTAEASDAAYEELEHTPAAIENFLENFDNTETADENTALELFQDYLKGEGFFYSPRTLKAFHTSLKVQNINPISVLAGLSGTGKTQLALQYAKFFNFYSEHVAVQPRWDSKDDLLGFYNFLEKRYQPTELVKALYYFHQTRNDSYSPMMMVILDEMNLARVEYYFSEFLSKLELRGNDRNQPDEKSKISIGTQLNSRDFFVGSNVVFVGTMNDDESTYSLSDKVLDRANVLHFGKPQKFEDDIHYDKVPPISIDADTFNEWCSQENFPNNFPEDLRTKINTLNDALDSVGKAFGYRVNKSITQYIQMYPDIKSSANPEESALLALADQIEMKIIPKLAGLEQNEKSDTCLSSIGNVISDTHDDELIAAFRDAKENYENSGMFLWRGVSRSIEQV